MKATGIVRRIDDLGRIVIPKEIRRTLRIRETDPLEIFTDKEGQIVLKKYSPIGELGEFAKVYAESLAQTIGYTVCVTDRDQVITASGSMKKEILGKPITKQLDEAIEERTHVLASQSENTFIQIIEDVECSNEAISPIICAGDVLGSVIILTKEHKGKFTETEEKLAKAAADFLGRQMES